MQNLIVGERYKVKHGQGNWEGEVTFDGYKPDVIQGILLKVKDIVVTGGHNKAFVIDYYEKKGRKAVLGATAEWWGFEPINFTLENE